MLYMILFLTVAIPCLWLASEIRGPRWLRICLGCGAIAMSYLVATGVGMLQRLNYNSTYGFASKQLIETTLDELAQGDTARVIANLKWIEREFQPTYENRANYELLVEQYANRFDQLPEPTPQRAR